MTINVTPEFSGHALHFRVAFRKTRQARRAGWTRTDHGGSLLDQRLDFPQHARRHDRPAGEHQDSVTHTIGQHQASVSNADSLEQHFGVDRIAVVPSGERRVHMRLGRHESGHVLAIKVAHVGHEQPLAQQVLAATQIGQPGSTLFPPGDVAIEVRSGRFPLIARADIQLRLMHVETQDIAGESGAESAVPNVLEHERIFFPVRPHRGERFGLTDRLAIDVRRGGRLLDRVADAVVTHPPHVAVRFGHSLPELTHGNIVGAQTLQRIDVRPERSTRFGMRTDAGRMSQITKSPVVPCHKQVADGAAMIPQESVRPFATAEDLARDDRQIGQGIIPAPPLKLRAIVGGPIGLIVSRHIGAHFVAVVVKVLERGAGEFTRVLNQLRAGRREVHIHRGRTEEIDFVALRTGTDTFRLGPEQCVTKPHDRPGSAGWSPVQASRVIELCGQVLHSLELAISVTRPFRMFLGEIDRRLIPRLHVAAIFDFPMQQTGAIRAHLQAGKRDDRDVTIISIHRVGLGQL